MKLTSEKSWADLSRDRYLWAEESFAAFLQKFDAERLIQASDNASRQVSVILYGPAQVGKTSLILTLLGIRDDCFTEVNTLLRGGQALGTMSTARTYRYRMAKDDFWYFSHCDNAQIPLNNEEAVAIFAGFRQEVEQGVREFESVDVFLPRRFFDLEQQDRVQLLIRDLPGTHSTNPNEQYYVKMLASRYMASADVVLLTGKVDGLAFLKSEELDNTLLNNWHWQQHRYKIVLTRAYSNATLQDLIKQKRFDKKAMRSFLLEQINTMELGLAESISKLIYPVECGHTWLEINARNDEFAHKCRELRRDVLQDLLDSLCQASNPLTRLRTGYALPRIIEQQMAEDQRYHEMETSLLHKQLSRLQKYITLYKERVTEYSDKTVELKRKMNEALQRYANALSISFHENRNDQQEDQLFHSSATPSLDTLKSRIQNNLNNYMKQWCELIMEHQLSVEKMPEMVNLNRVLNRLNSYWFDTYFLKKTCRKDEGDIEYAVKEDVSCLNVKYRQLVTEKFSSEEKKLKKKIIKNERIEHRLMRVVDYLLGKEKQIQERLDRMSHEFDISQARDSMRLQESKNFLHVIVQAKNDRAREIEKNARNVTISRSERLAWLLMYKALINDFDYVKSLYEESCKVE